LFDPAQTVDSLKEHEHEEFMAMSDSVGSSHILLVAAVAFVVWLRRWEGGGTYTLEGEAAEEHGGSFVAGRHDE
jgi:hypothetical protein